MKLDSRGGESLAAVRIQRLDIMFHLLSCEVVRHEVSGPAEGPHELHSPAEGLLLQLEGAYVQVTHAADPSAF